MNTRSVFLTGATGFLGRRLACTLTERGYQVRALVRDVHRAASLLPAGTELIQGDLSQDDVLAEGMAGCRWVIHAAARLGGWGGYELFRKDNIEGTRSVLSAAAVRKVPHIVFVSSAAVYGRQPNVRLSEESRCLPEQDPYCLTKLAAEQLMRDHCIRHGTTGTIIRPSIIYGPGDSHFLPLVLDQIRRGTLLAIGQKHQGPPLVFVDDVCELILATMCQEEGTVEVYNVSSEDRPSWEEITHMVSKTIGIPCGCLRIPYSIGYAAGVLMDLAYRLARRPHPPLLTPFTVSLVGLQYLFDPGKAAGVPGFRGFTPFSQGIRRSCILPGGATV